MLLDKIQDHQALSSCINIYEISKTLIAPSDQEGVLNCNEMITDLTTLKTTFKELSQEVYRGIQSHSCLRNEAVEDQLGL